MGLDVDAEAVESRADLARFLAELATTVELGQMEVENESVAAVLEAAYGGSKTTTAT